MSLQAFSVLSSQVYRYVRQIPQINHSIVDVSRRRVFGATRCGPLGLVYQRHARLNQEPVIVDIVRMVKFQATTPAIAQFSHFQ